MKKQAAPALTPQQLTVDVARPTAQTPSPSQGEAILCAIRSAGRTLIPPCVKRARRTRDFICSLCANSRL